MNPEDPSRLDPSPFDPSPFDPSEAASLREEMAVAASAAQRDRFPWLLAGVAAALLGVLALGALAQARFAAQLTFLHQDKPVPDPLYAVEWTEPPRTLDDIMRSIHAERGR